MALFRKMVVALGFSRSFWSSVAMLLITLGMTGCVTPHQDGTWSDPFCFGSAEDANQVKTVQDFVGAPRPE